MANVIDDICNRALGKLGAKRIRSLTEDSASARACNTAYVPVRDAFLEEHEWSFAIKRAELSAESPAPTWGPAYAYLLPADFIRLAEDDQARVDCGERDWIIENGRIKTDDSAPLQIRYISRVSDVSMMTPLFREGLATKLAFELCEQLTQSNTKKDELREDLKDVISRGKKSNAFQKPSKRPPEDTWVTARL